MTVESLIFIVLGLLAVGFIIKAAAAGGSKRKSSGNSGNKQQGGALRQKLRLATPLPDGFEANLEKFLDKKRLIEAIKYVRETTSLDLRDSKQLVDWVNSGNNLHDLVSEIGKDERPKSDVIKPQIDSSVAYADAGPTAELQAISDIDAMQRAQILVSKGQVIEAVKVLHEDAGYNLKKAAETVDSMGKKVYPAD